MPRLALALVVLLTLGAALYGCGDSGEDGAEQLAKQQELRAAREQAARDARQGVRITELERRLRAQRRAEDLAAPTGVVDTDPVEVDSEVPLLGLWKGEAVIEYDSGETDPFHQSIELDLLTVGAVAGYSEARQGSSTCHGPLTYEGVTEGWYRFSAAERNVAQCIDYSVVELMPDSSGGLLYRETTDVSVSSGSLGRVR